ncbi:cytochrome c oxidase accessory protein CcoG [Hydrogenophaga crassostreae]|uniref:Cytochrome c oxidase accessory protein CcoG n=1 Tax=Hydrogenophaga crassostreae TaxID=1763535 RepID=A0A167GJP0_9BURK|nr:cytochrome c oxidase accessory protein CcoG [Hydrogenophaga crassostreae]AOW15085.1 cytochrome c oxidase accessory protein CcoG [Hydrogenophaga crassostreae]OAD39538.1 cytochrome c oxidase accessory protein CcoG [Hydrogenophaga crassostreae]
MSNTPDPVEQPVFLTLYQKQEKIYPRAVTGLFARWRWVMVWLTQMVFYGLPWLTWNGRQALLFNLDTRQFYIFGLVLQPQDFIYLAALLVLSALALFFFTAVAGRLWCGYTCPQTVYTEIFLWVERRLEGDRSARIRLDARPWGINKFLRKGGKQAAWLAIGLFTGFTFVGYFVPIQSLATQVLALKVEPSATFWIFFYGFATYGNAGFLREQVCKYMCPYARFQSALIDMDSLVIAYDAKRGEGRGARSRKADPKALGLGDCIDCTLCVQVCPTGIDIRDGLQNECIACAACIDVCDDVMDKMGYEPGLIRYSSGNAMEKGWSAVQMVKRVWRPRVLIYGALLLVLGGGFIWSLSHRADFRADLSRDRGSLARMTGPGNIENTYTLHITNSDEQAHRYTITVEGLDGLRLDTPAELTVAATSDGKIPVRLVLPAMQAQPLQGQTLPIQLVVSPEGAPNTTGKSLNSTFLIPR